MYVAGIDIGSSTTKVLVLNQRDTVAARITETLPDSSEKAMKPTVARSSRCGWSICCENSAPA